MFTKWSSGERSAPATETLFFMPPNWRVHNMRKLLNKVRQFRKDEDGAALVEYVIILGLILAVSLVVLGSIGTNANTIFTAVNNAMAAAAAAA